MPADDENADSRFAYTNLAIQILQEAAEKKYVEEVEESEETLIEDCLKEKAVEIEEVDENQLRAAVLQVYTGDLSIYINDRELKVEDLKQRLESLLEDEKDN